MVLTRPLATFSSNLESLKFTNCVLFPKKITEFVFKESFVNILPSNTQLTISLPEIGSNLIASFTIFLNKQFLTIKCSTDSLETNEPPLNIQLSKIICLELPINDKP